MCQDVPGESGERLAEFTVMRAEPVSGEAILAMSNPGTCVGS